MIILSQIASSANSKGQIFVRGKSSKPYPDNRSSEPSSTKTGQNHPMDHHNGV